jgi:hypothetical protein
MGIDPGALLGAFGSSSAAGSGENAKSQFPKEYGKQAELAFKQGYEQLADDLLLAHLAFEAESAADAYSEARFSRVLKRPAWNLRWGMAIAVRTPDEFDGNYDPITRETSGGTGGGGGYGGGRGGSGMILGPDAGGSGMSSVMGGGPGNRPGGGAAGMGAAGMGQTFDSVADIPETLGLYGEVAAEMFDKRFLNGDYGTVFSRFARAGQQTDADGQGPGMQRPGAGGPGMLQPGGAGPGFGGRGMQGPGGQRPGAQGPGPQDPGLSGMLGAGMAGSAPEGYPGMEGGQLSNYPGMSGNSGPANPGGGFQSAMGGGGPAGGMFDQLEPANPRWRPGMVYLGQHPIREAVSEAEKAGVDILLLFEVRIERRREDMENDTRARVILVGDPKQTFATSKRLTNTEVKNRNRSGDADPKKMVEDAMEPLFADIDRKLALSDLPAINSEQAQNRVAALIGDADVNPIRALAEVRLYQHLSLLDDDDVLVANELMLGDDGIKLIAASEKIRREVAHSLQKPISGYGEIGLPDPAAQQTANRQGGLGMGPPGMGSAFGSGNPAQPGGMIGSGGMDAGGVNGAVSSGGLLGSGPGMPADSGMMNSGMLNSGGANSGGANSGGANSGGANSGGGTSGDADNFNSGGVVPQGGLKGGGFNSGGSIQGGIGVGSAGVGGVN